MGFESARLMKFYCAIVFLLAWASCPSLGYAQSCPHGYMPLGGQGAGWTGCAPINASNIDPPDPGPQWASRWGAVATSADGFGASQDQRSKREAKKAALKSCKENGASKCKVVQYFLNQCAALAWGETFGTNYRAGTKEDAEKMALERCSSRTGDCRIFFSGCSYPQRVQ